MNKKEILKLPIYKNQIGKYLTKKDIVSNFPHNFEIKDGIEYEYATTSGTTSDRMEIIRKPNWWKDEYKRTYSNEKKLEKYLDEKLHKVIFTTAQCSNLVCFVEKPSMEKRTIGNTLYVNNTFNPWDWTKENIQEIIKEITEIIFLISPPPLSVLYHKSGEAAIIIHYSSAKRLHFSLFI